MAIAAGGNVAATAVRGASRSSPPAPVTIGITLEQYEERIKKRERELREEFTESKSRTD